MGLRSVESEGGEKVPYKGTDKGGERPTAPASIRLSDSCTWTLTAVRGRPLWTVTVILGR